MYWPLSGKLNKKDKRKHLILSKMHKRYPLKYSNLTKSFEGLHLDEDWAIRQSSLEKVFTASGKTISGDGTK